MAKSLWGNVYYQDMFAGILKEEPGKGYSFTYDEVYIDSFYPSIAYTLPKQKEPHFSRILHPFFDNLVAEGWLEQVQTRLLGKRSASRFELLLSFGFDCIGAVWIEDPAREERSTGHLQEEDLREKFLLKSHASLSGVQAKMAVIEKEGKYYPTEKEELSTHIAKFSSPQHPDIIENEYLTTKALLGFLPHNPIVSLDIASVEGINDQALIIHRFDRKDGKRIHFEEFNQLLGRQSGDKYAGTYGEISQFLRGFKGSLPLENHRLFQIIVAGILVGNTDMHLKNFAMIYGPQGPRLSPSYDIVSAALYGYKSMALGLAEAYDRNILDIKTKHIFMLGEEFGLSRDTMIDTLHYIKGRKKHVEEVLSGQSIGSKTLKEKIIKFMDARWNTLFG